MSKINLTRFQQEGISYLQKCSEKDIVETIKWLNHAYYNNEGTYISDTLYDMLREYVQKHWPNNPVLKEIGAPTFHKKVQLPFCLPSLDKIKPDTNALSLWLQRHSNPPSYIVSNKLDGVSALFTNGALYTRGDGFVGQIISHLIPTFRRFPLFPLSSSSSSSSSLSSSISVRGEIIVLKENWTRGGYSKSFANIRNMVSGIVNSKQPPKSISNSLLDFVAYELIEPAGLSPLNQLKFLENAGFTTVKYSVLNLLEMTNTALSQILITHRSHYDYEIDGLVVAHDAVYKRPNNGNNPSHAFAFKMLLEDQRAEASVVDVLWTTSKDGYLKPRVQIQPIQLCGVKIEYATGFNAKFIQDNAIGIGAVIIMERSGDVIPTIRGVLQPAVAPKMPPELAEGTAQWSTTGVDLILVDPASDVEVQKKKIAVFFRTMKIDGLSEGNIQRIFEAGFQSISAILQMTRNDFLKVKGFQDVMADKLHAAIRVGVLNASLTDWMVASGIFGRGFGSRKLQTVLDCLLPLTRRENVNLSTLLKQKSSEEWIAYIVQNSSGIGVETARDFILNIEAFLQFLEQSGPSGEQGGPNFPVRISGEQGGEKEEEKEEKKQMVVTKLQFKNEILQWVSTQGAVLSETVNKKTDLVICGSLLDDSTKLKRARSLGIRIVEESEILRLYK